VGDQLCLVYSDKVVDHGSSVDGFSSTSPVVTTLIATPSVMSMCIQVCRIWCIAHVLKAWAVFHLPEILGHGTA